MDSASPRPADRTIFDRADGQADLGVFRAADELDDLAQFHVHDIHRRFVRLRDRDDFIARLEQPAFCRRSAGDKRADDAIAVCLAQLRPDAEKAEAHLDGKLRRVLHVEIIRVRVVGMRKRVEVNLQNVGAVRIGHLAQQPVVTPLEFAGDSG